MTPVTDDYGWREAAAPHTAAYLQGPIVNRVVSAGCRRVLDLGCGNGALCASLAAAGVEAVGVDADAQGVAIARQARPDLRFHHQSFDDDPRGLVQREGLFDAVVSTEVIEHLYAPAQLPRFARVLLKPGGLLLVTTPYHGYLKNLALSLVDGWDHHHTVLWPGGHIKFFSRATLTQLLQAEGFRVTGFQGLGRAPWLWKSMLVAATSDTSRP